jgi:hypothetical protein
MAPRGETAVDSLPARALPRGTRRHFNLAIAHGSPGAIGLLPFACDARGSRRPAGSAALLNGAVRWLLAHGFPAARRRASRVGSTTGLAAPAARQGWCYGDTANREGPGLQMADVQGKSLEAKTRFDDLDDPAAARDWPAIQHTQRGQRAGVRAKLLNARARCAH